MVTCASNAVRGDPFRDFAIPNQAQRDRMASEYLSHLFSACGGACFGYRREAARPLPTPTVITALEGKNVLVNSWLITLLDSTATTRTLSSLAYYSQA